MNIFFQIAPPGVRMLRDSGISAFHRLPHHIRWTAPPEKCPPRRPDIRTPREKNIDKTGISAIICAGSQSGYTVRTSYE
jgi:hypothetical protein